MTQRDQGDIVNELIREKLKDMLRRQGLVKGR